MDKSSNQLGVNPLTRVSALSAVASIGTPVQELESRAENLAKQQAGLLSKVAEFALTESSSKSVPTTTVSYAAKYINQSLKQAEANGVSEKYISHQVIGHDPKHPELFAKQLKAAITNTGLFYESHLKEFVEGHRHLNAIKSEPQNQLKQPPQTLLPQQLQLFEHQRLSWHGEVWPNQVMDWNVQLQNGDKEKEQKFAQHSESEPTIVSDLTLHLPRLGKVSANISIKNGLMQIGILADDKATLAVLNTNKATLTNAIVGHGQALASLTVASNE